MRYKIFTKMMPVFFLSAALAQGQSPTLSQQEQIRQLNEKLQELQRLREQLIQQQQGLQQGGGGRGAAPGIATPFGTAPRMYSPTWWNNSNVVAQLGLTDDQKSKIEKIYESRKANIAADSAILATQEAQLAALLSAEPVDHNAVLAQIDRVAQARADLERANSGMSLEMREVLTASQWTQLQKLPVSGLIYSPFGPIANPREGGPGQRNGGPRGGQRQQ
jgi:Spy/CpxP family protein refolding chaperone